jgi:hydroxymethylpyrimidine pyrophosphatase-like HAD family hydrolase
MNIGVEGTLQEFLRTTSFTTAGGVMTDLDGTAVHEWQGRIIIPEQVATALKYLNDLGRPAMINSLRFPLNVIQTFGREWYSITNAPLPMVSLNGSMVGYLIETDKGEIGFRELEAFPVSSEEIEKILTVLADLLRNTVKDFVLFFYPRDWTKGELIWTYTPDHVQPLQLKYRSASEVFSSSLDDLRDRLLREQICMMFLLIETPQDHLMAYQHTNRSQFVTRSGVDKRFGAEVLARKLDIDLKSSVGAGDTVMDTFLTGVGLAVKVGTTHLDYQGMVATVNVSNSVELGDLLFKLAELHRDISAG